MGHFVSPEPKWFTLYLERSELSMIQIYFSMENFQKVTVLLHEFQVALLVTAQFGDKNSLTSCHLDLSIPSNQTNAWLKNTSVLGLPCLHMLCIYVDLFSYLSQKAVEKKK